MHEFDDPDTPAIEKTLQWLHANGMDIYKDSPYARKFAKALVKGRALYNFKTWMNVPQKSASAFLMPIFREMYKKDAELRAKALAELLGNKDAPSEAVDWYFSNTSGDPDVMFLMKYMPAGVRDLKDHWTKTFLANAGYFMYNAIRTRLEAHLGDLMPKE